MEIIRVENLGKTYKIQKNNQGFIKSFTSLIKKEWEQKVALDNINFTINKGDIVGYIGPNGAGKSTTIKILAGILHPSVGQVLVNGIVPYKERIKNARRIALVTGQRTNLFWDLPIIDTFNLMKRVYKIPQDKFKKNLDMLTDIIGVGEFINTPARQLSLGQRMRADIVAVMLHDPDIVYLDEPTIGLDVVAKDSVRNFFKAINEQKNTTIILTSHDLEDIERLCNRVIVIDNGKLVYSGDIKHLMSQYGNEICTLCITVEDDTEDFEIDGCDIERNLNKLKLKFNRNSATPPVILNRLLERGIKVVDFTLNEPCLEDTIKVIYGSKEVGEPIHK